MRIWDLHCHLPSSFVPGASLIEQADNMLEIAGRVGIEKTCLFLRTGRSSGPNSDDEILRTLERHQGRVFGFVWCNLPQIDESIDNIQKWIGDGPMVGLKLGGSSGICNKPEYDPIFRRAMDVKAVIFQHTWIKLGGNPPRPGGGNLPRESEPQHLADLASRYPDYPFICGHTGGDWELGIRMVQDQPNVVIGIGGGYPTTGMVEMGVRELGAERILYGSDVTGRSFAAQLGKVHGASIPEDQKQAIFYDNLLRLMQPIFKEKGWDIA